MSTRLQRSEVPVEQTWNLTDLFPSDEAWEKELKAVQDDVSQVTQYKGTLVSNATILLQGLTAFENYRKRLIQVGTYAHLRASADGSDPTNQRDAAKFSSAMASISAKLSFIQSELLTLSYEQVEQFLQEEAGLVTFKKLLTDTLEQKPYTLAPEIEETLAALGEVHDAPFMIYERSKSSDMTFDSIQDNNGNELPMSAALYEDRYELEADTRIRRDAYQSFIKTLNQYKHTYAATYATEVTKQVTLARLRNYDSVTDMLLTPQEVTKEMYHNQLDISQKELAPHMRRYAKLMKEKLGLDELQYADLKAPLDPEFNPTTTYEEAKSIILEALQVMGSEYSEIIQKGLNERWVDLADNVGKQTGAFCASPYGVHPYILITWTDKMRGAFILAHELGHAGHFYLAGANQSLVNTSPSTYFVEAPSTINELLLANHLLNKTNDKRMKRWVITQLLGTYYHNFVTHLLEGEYQRRVYDLAEAGTPLTADVLTEQKLEALQNFWGDTVSFDDAAGLTWMRQPHYYMGLYPYTYSAGLTISTAVAQRIQSEGKVAADNWLEVLKAGGSLKPLDLIKKAGVDMSKPDAIKETVAYIGSLVDELEKSYD
ncbi:oligopeptidase F. Metallo peptidase. MEROPS family M03B [Gracilibacillus orientalis]|uniref:Oligopeptidase F n=1 Tax=Gracilibacillus orientalis TaxID=334253 RepID=A0A1I4ISW5_9BACI|nr:oligoendopeptidase F [Gracilibacillus orientalis]SFL56866.1 oligopeptidase F. Metallo peptidase. MEROPS family M03B [Gracilibacillus orientalis]